MARIRPLLAGFLLLLLVAACQGNTPDYSGQAFPRAGSFERVRGEQSPGVVEVWRALSQDGQTLGYSALAQAQGFHGPVQVAVAWTPGQGISHVQVVQEEESPDYGGVHLHSPWFTEQFIGNLRLREYNLVKMERKVAEDIVIITGATASSQAAIQAVNLCLEMFRSLEEEVDIH